VTSDAGVNGEERVRFLGRVIASVSHELKNALATVSESAGLISDILRDPAPSEQDAAEVRVCAEAVADELRRSFGIIGRLNAFAHSADHAIAEVEVRGLVDLTAALAGYLSFASPVRIMDTGDGEVRIETSPLQLEDLVYRLLESAFRLRHRGSEVRVAVRGVEGGAEIRLSELGRYRLDDLLSEESRHLVGVLGGHLLLDAEVGELGIRLPHRIRSRSGA